MVCSPWDAHLVGYANDVAAINVFRNVEDTERKVNQVIIRKESWLEGKGLKLAMEKTELILLTRKCIPVEINITTCDPDLTTWKVINNLGIRLDRKLTFWVQIRYATTKAVKVTSLFSGLMANIGGPIQSRRRLMMAITDSVLLYGR